MNQFVPDWTNNMGDAFAPLGGEDDGLMELLWCNGHVVMQSQAPPRKPPPRCFDKEAPAQQEQDNAAWFQYPVEDQLERDLFSELFGETPADACKVEEECGAGTTPLMPPPQWPAALKQQRACAEDAAGVSGCAVDGGCKSAPAAAVETAGGGRESSMLTIGSSFCGSNHVQTTTPRAAAPPRTTTADAATSSSMHQSRRCAAARARPPAAHHRNSKRKQQRDATETTNEDVEFESAVVTCEPQAQKMTTAKRRRAAEVHNLSERRRRDRINEKMKALQELIPHCNKTDKASMLDEAIEYLKSLQLQLQVMWMGGGMAAAAPVMFPGGVHHQYMQRMVGPPHVASMPRMPPFMAPPPPAVQSQVDHYARCFAVDSLQQPTAPMGMGFYQQQNPAPPPQPVVPGGSLPAATVRTSPADSSSHRKHENSSKPDVKDVSS